MMDVERNMIVTGAAGFVGAGIVRHFSSLGSKVEGIDVVKAPESFPGEEYFRADISNEMPLADDAKWAGSDVVHCAALMRAPDEETFWRVNVEGTRHVLDWAVRNRARSFTFFSTGGVYGYSDGEYVTEEARTKPVGIYGHTKWIGEQVCRMAAMEHGLPVTVFRLYFPYGPNQNSGIFAFIDRAVAEGREMTVNQDGAPRFRPTHVADIAEAVRLGIETIEQAPFRVFNLCGDDEVSFLKLVRLYEKKHGKTAVFKQRDEKDGDLLGDNTKIKHDLNWKPRCSVEEVLTHG